MKLEEATKEQRTAVMVLMLHQFLHLEKSLGVPETDEMHLRWRKAIEALPEMGEDIFKVNPELRAAAELCLNRMFPIEPASSPSGLAEWKAKCDQRPPHGWWAPGEYMNVCRRCSKLFIGDKRSGHCADCAYDGTSNTPLVAGMEENLK